MNSFIVVSVIVSTLGKFASAFPLGKGALILQADDSMNAFMEGRMLNHKFASPPFMRKGLIIVTTVATHDGYVAKNMSILLSAKVNGKDVVSIPIEQEKVIENVMVKEQYNPDLQYANRNFNPAQLDPDVDGAVKSGINAIHQFWKLHKHNYCEGLEELQFAYRPYWIISEGPVLSKFVKVIAVADLP